MKFLHKKTLILVALLSVSGYSFGYTYQISNATDKTLVVRLVERTISKSDQYATLKPGEEKAIKFPGMWCLQSIHASAFDKLADVPSDMTKIALINVAMKMEPREDKKAVDVNPTQKASVGTALSNDKNKTDVSATEKASVVKEEPSNDTSKDPLTVIGEAITVLTEESLCRNRKFTLTFTGKKAQKTIGGKTYNLPYDEIIATTSKGG